MPLPYLKKSYLITKSGEEMLEKEYLRLLKLKGDYELLKEVTENEKQSKTDD